MIYSQVIADVSPNSVLCCYSFVSAHKRRCAD